jgi:threonine dehydrogenase-like Zn-dependent dehydrogenase
MARWLGAAEVLAIDTDESRRAIAPRFGASRVLDGRLPPEELKRQVREATAGRGADVLLEFTGNSDAMEAGFELLRFGGRYLLAGATFPSRPLALPGEQIVRRMLRLEGVYNYEPQDLQRALRFLSECAGQFPFTSLVGKTFPLDRIQEAFTYAETQRPPRVALLPL